MKIWYEIYQKVNGNLALSIDKADTFEEAEEYKKRLEKTLNEKLFIDKWILDETGEHSISGIDQANITDVVMGVFDPKQKENKIEELSYDT